MPATYFVQTEKAQLFDDRCRAHFACRSNFTRYLQPNFDNLQGISKHHLNRKI